MTNFNGTPLPSAAAELALEYTELDRRVARRIGATLVVVDRSVDTANRISDIISTGLRWFYFPGGEVSHLWSFLRKTTTITTVIGTNWYALPTDFIRLAGRIAIPSSTYPVRTEGEEAIRMRINNESAADATPRYAAVRISPGVSPTAYLLGLYPAPAVVEGITTWYAFEPGTVSSLSPYVIGGSSHAQTILAACMAAADHELDPEVIGEGGGQAYQLFQKLLVESIEADKKITDGMNA